MAPGWAALDVRDNILNINAYDALAAPNNAGRYLAGGDLHPLLAEGDVYATYEAQELVNEIMSYSYEKWFGLEARTLSRSMSEGRFNPYEKDTELAFKGFGRPNLLSDRSIRAYITRTRETAGWFPAPEYALRSASDQDLAVLTGRSDFGSLPQSQKISALSPIFAAGLDATMDQLQADAAARDVYERVVMNFYDSIGSANFTWWRAGEVTETSEATWNGRYGPPTQDQQMHMFVRYNWYMMDRVFGADAAAARSVLFAGEDIDWELTYDEAIAQLSLSLRSTLDQGIADLNRPSTYIYWIALRLDEYRDMRANSYIDHVRRLEWSRHVAPGPRVRT
jgi:hypothetical protein